MAERENGARFIFLSHASTRSDICLNLNILTFHWQTGSVVSPQLHGRRGNAKRCPDSSLHYTKVLWLSHNYLLSLALSSASIFILCTIWRLDGA
jgi:hypothetical protein